MNSIRDCSSTMLESEKMIGMTIPCSVWGLNCISFLLWNRLHVESLNLIRISKHKTVLSRHCTALVAQSIQRNPIGHFQDSIGLI